VAVADVNDDGHPDLIVANVDSNTVSVLLGNGNGTFQAAQNFATGKFPASVAVADVNGDGHLDLVTANEGDNTVSVLLGNGNGTFQAAQNFATDARPDAIAVADLNGDGLPDLVSVNEDGYTVSVLLGKGNGTFQAARNYRNASDQYCVAVADVNGDGLADVVSCGYISNTVCVLFGERTAVTHLLVTAPSSVTAGTAFTITVSALTASGQVDDVYTGTVHFTSSDGSAVLPKDYMFTKGDLGVHTFTVTLNTTGSQTITATDTLASKITGTATVTVNPAAAAPPPAGGRSNRTAPASAAPDAPRQEDSVRAEVLAAVLADDRLLGTGRTQHPVAGIVNLDGHPMLRDAATLPSAIQSGATVLVHVPPLLSTRRPPGSGLGMLDPILVDALFAET
jgi:hypothetical protein